jgi:hypothetical protein
MVASTASVSWALKRSLCRWTSCGPCVPPARVSSPSGLGQFGSGPEFQTETLPTISCYVRRPAYPDVMSMKRNAIVLRDMAIRPAGQ